MNRLVPSMSVFEAEVTKAYEFLVADFDFCLVKDAGDRSCPSMYVGISFQNSDLDITIYNERGDAGVSIRVKKKLPWLRDYMSKVFELGEILHAFAPHEIEAATEGRWKAISAGRDPGDGLVEWLARCLRDHCQPILRGDYTMLELISGERRRQGSP
jgi:hypothetical protein